jgi:hypothetical protein
MKIQEASNEMKNKNSSKLNQLIIILSSGLCVLSAKKREGSSIVALYITDYTNSTRVVFDIEEKKIIANRDDVDFTADDIEMLCGSMKMKSA